MGVATLSGNSDVGATANGDEDHAEPCVERSSLQLRDQWRDVIEAFRGIVCSGLSGDADEFALHMRMQPSGLFPPEASRSGCQGHHARA